MNEIKYPETRIFWTVRNTTGDIIHFGVTETNQVTTSGFPEMNTNESGIIISGLTSEQVDELLIDISESNFDGSIIYLEDAPRTSASDDAVNKLTANGITVITVIA